MTMQKGICEECKKEYEYEYNPKYPRKYCHECSAKKKAEYSGGDVPVVKPGERVEIIGKTINPPGTTNKNTTIYMSYAKDIFCAMLGKNEENVESTMLKAIRLVKQARDSFK